jgi:hypothetical protein
VLDVVQQEQDVPTAEMGDEDLQQGLGARRR